MTTTTCLVIERGSFIPKCASMTMIDPRTNHLILIDDTAQLCHAALTGRYIQQDPHEANTYRARFCRARLSTPQTKPEWIAWETIRMWGSVLRPWWGLALQDRETGQILPNKWDRLWSLANGQMIPLDEVQYIGGEIGGKN